MTVDVTDLSCECQRIFVEKQQQFKRVQWSSVISANNQTQEVGEEEEGLTQEAKKTAIMNLFVQAWALLSRTLITSSLRAQKQKVSIRT